MPALKPRRSWLQAFPPTAFAMVMATGIVSIAAHLLDYDTVGWLLLGINAVRWPVLLAITLCRLLRYPRAVHADVVDHSRGPGFLTLVAATAMLGSQRSVYRVLPRVVPSFLGLAAAMWLVITYTFLAAMTIGQSKPGLHTGLNGTWPLLLVATESIAVLATAVSRMDALFIEKHVIVGEPVRYTAAEWSVVFPLGMYSAATCLYAEATQLHALSSVARVTVVVAFAAWALASVGLLRAALRSVTGK
ncbi:hypothetical protein FSB08_03305 [Paraburkholderia sp. JPY432]|uniref:tellurite resistance/C4-dicarboxylate transporter family protein n=1 Tax=Paraburkholderia youngii TaxID=2782701 RepID=UPI0015959473|nr:tellurite resistance/C4-dicarboxylate transporter family protein [Paraburkholderia youngii]NVH71597.1 hypothetical protein [Paraburkholderia youngii]